MRDSCLYCGHAPLVQVRHWKVCPHCSSDYLEAIKPPSLASQIQAAVGGLIIDRGIPYYGGKPAYTAGNRPA